MDHSKRDAKIAEALHLIAESASMQGLTLADLAEKVNAAGKWEEWSPDFEKMLSTNLIMLDALKSALTVLYETETPTTKPDADQILH